VVSLPNAPFSLVLSMWQMRSFSLVLLRRLLFRPAPATNNNSNPTSPAVPRLTLYDHLSHQTLATLERLFLFSFSHEVSPHVRRKTFDTVCDLLRHDAWSTMACAASPSFSMIQSQATQDGGAALRESAFRVFSGCPNLVMDLQTDAVLNVLGRGLQDQYSIEVRFIVCHRVTFLIHVVGSTRGFVGFSGVPFFSRDGSAFPINISAFSNARHSSSPCSISLPTSTRFQFFFGICSTYIQLPLSIYIPFCPDTALHITSQPLFSSFGFATHIPTRSYIAASRLWSYADNGSPFSRKWRYQQWLTRCIHFPTSFGGVFIIIYILVPFICRSILQLAFEPKFNRGR
jgi:hypothetical protein